LKATAIILAGGASKRFGSDKSKLRVGGELLIERSIRTWGRLFSQIIIVSSTGSEFYIPGVSEVVDIYQGRGPLGGVHAGLRSAKYDWAFVAACDMPSINGLFIKELFGSVTENVRIVIPNHDNIIEPLCALYHKDCGAYAEYMLENDRNCILDMYKSLPTLYVKTQNCFYNINYPEDLIYLDLKRENKKSLHKNRLDVFCRERGFISDVQ